MSETPEETRKAVLNDIANLFDMFVDRWCVRDDLEGVVAAANVPGDFAELMNKLLPFLRLVDRLNSSNLYLTRKYAPTTLLLFRSSVVINNLLAELHKHDPEFSIDSIKQPSTLR